MKHTPAVCSVKGCKEEAQYFFAKESMPFGTFYLCDEHNQFLAPEDSYYHHIADDGSLVSDEIGVYQCNENCEECL